MQRKESCCAWILRRYVFFSSIAKLHHLEQYDIITLPLSSVELSSHSFIYSISKITLGGRGNYFHFTDEETEKISHLLTAPDLHMQPCTRSLPASLCRRQGQWTLGAGIPAAETNLRVA